MTSDEALRRIEERHATDKDDRGEFCRHCDRWRVPCDTVKLARALAHAHEWLVEEGCDCGTDEPGSCALCEAERVLAEVAGE